MSESLIDQDGGWIPFDERGYEGQMLTEEFHERIGDFEDRMTRVDTPERVILHELEIKVTGKLLPRPKQLTGSCVGVGGARAYTHAMLGDVYVKGESEEIQLMYPYATYGVGREIAGMRSTGSGSYGGAQAKAVQQFGMVDVNHPKVPKGTIRDGWQYWTSQQELQWSHPRAWPTPKDEMAEHANQHQVLDVARIRSTDGLKQALAQCYGVTAASSFGARPRVRGDVLYGPRSGSWSHQMSLGAYWEHPDLGLIFLLDNQWGGNAHGICPTLSKIKDSTGNFVNGSFWIPESDAQWICDRGEVYSHSSTEGFSPRVINWGEFSGFKFD